MLWMDLSFAVEYLSFCLKAIITPVLVLLMSLCLLLRGLERVAAVLLTNVPMSCKSIVQGQQRGSFDVTMNIFCSELQCAQRCQLSRGISFPFTLVFVSSYIYLPPAILLCSMFTASATLAREFPKPTTIYVHLRFEMFIFTFFEGIFFSSYFGSRQTLT